MPPTRKQIGKILFDREDINFINFDPCPSPPNESGFCGSQRDIQRLTGRYCEAKSPGIHHEVAVDICKRKQEMLK